jgi:hypothetical protein
MKRTLAPVIIVFFAFFFLLACGTTDNASGVAATSDGSSKASSGAGQAVPTASQETKTPLPSKEAMHPARAHLDSAAASVALSEPSEVTIILDDVKDLYGVEVHLTFDPAIVQVEDLDPGFPGIQLTAGKAFSSGSSFVALNRANNDTGTIDFAVTLFKPAEPLQGNVEVASFSFIAVKSGSADIDFVQVLLADKDANPLPVVSEGITIRIKP